MHMFDTFNTAWQRTVDHQDRLLRSADRHEGRRTGPRHPLRRHFAE